MKKLFVLAALVVLFLGAAIVAVTPAHAAPPKPDHMIQVLTDVIYDSPGVPSTREGCYGCTRMMITAIVGISEDAEFPMTVEFEVPSFGNPIGHNPEGNGIMFKGYGVPNEMNESELWNSDDGDINLYGTMSRPPSAGAFAVHFIYAVSDSAWYDGKVDIRYQDAGHDITVATPIRVFRPGATTVFMPKISR